MNYVAYLRCSTQEQAKSGLGFEAQRVACNQFITNQNGTLQSAYIEQHSGGDNNRPKLLAALDECKRTGATLVVAKLDRLSRNVAYIAGLIEQMGKFKCADCPDDDVMMLQLRAVFAEEERRKISQRTTAALAALKARGKKLGGYRERSYESRADTAARMRTAKANKRRPTLAILST